MIPILPKGGSRSWRVLARFIHGREVRMCGTPLPAFSHATIFTNAPVKISTPLDAINHNVISTKHTDFELGLSTLDRMCINPSQIAFGVKYMAQQQYQKLVSTTPWLQTNSHMAYIQLVLKGDLIKVMQPVLQDENMRRLVELVEKNVESFSNKETVETLLSLLYVGYDSTTPVIHKLLAHCKSHIHDYDLQCLSVTSFVFKALKRCDYAMLQLILQQHKKLLAPLASCVNPDNLYAHCVLTVNLGLYHSEDFWVQCSDYLNDAVTHSLPRSSCSGEMVATIIQTGHYLWRSPHCRYPVVPRQILLTATQFLPELIGQLGPLNLRQVVRSLRQSRCLSEELSHKLDHRAESILKTYGNDLHISDVSNLLGMTSKSSDKSLILNTENLLFNKLKDSEVDIVTLSHIAEALVETDSNNTDLLWLVQDQIIRNADSVLTHLSRYHKIFPFLLKKKFIDPEHKDKLADILITSLVEKQHGLVVRNMSATVASLLPNTKESIPKELFDKLVSSIPSWTDKPLQKLLQGLNNLQTKQHLLNPDLRRQISHIYSMLYVNIVDRIEHISNYRDLYIMTQTLLIQNKHKDPQIIEKLMAMHRKLLPTLTELSFGDVLLGCKYARYFDPNMCDHLSAFLIEHDDMPDTRVNQFVHFLGIVGYEPSNMDKLLPVIEKTLSNYEKEGKLFEYLSVLSNLMLIEYFPEEHLRKIFTLDFLNKVDLYIQAKPERQKDMEKVLMELNRCTVVEYPQLEVPWFSDKYCKDHTMKENQEIFQSHASKLRSEVEDMLCLVIPDAGDVYKRWTSSPYYHSISFEFVLDKAQTPIKFSESFTKNMSDCQRVALLVHTERHYCFHSKNLLGSMSLLHRHLAILGYKVISVPYYDWYSMALSDQKAKVEYLRKKIFS